MIEDGTSDAGLRSNAGPPDERTRPAQRETFAHRRVTHAQWRIVEILARCGQALTAPQIAARIGRTRQAAQKQLNLLRQATLIRAEPNPLDKRSRLYVLSELGEQRFAEARRGGRSRRSTAKPATATPSCP